MIVEQGSVLIFSLLGMDAALNPAFALATGLASMGNEVVFIHLTDEDGEALNLTDGLIALQMALEPNRRWRLPWMRKTRHHAQLDVLNRRPDLVFSFDCTVSKLTPQAQMISFWSGSSHANRTSPSALSHYQLCLSTDANAFAALTKAHGDVRKTAPFFWPRSCETWHAQRYRTPEALVLLESEATAHAALGAVQRTGLLRLNLFETRHGLSEHELYRRFGECDLIIDLRRGVDCAWLQLHALHSGRHCVFAQNALNAPATTVTDAHRVAEVLQNILPRIDALNHPDEQRHRREFAWRFTVEEWLDALPNL
jgi:hypothetical protein